jgi:general secretion pathway protein H
MPTLSAPVFPPQWPRRAYRRPAVAGMSLLEMLLVLALMAAIGLIAAMAMNGGLAGMRLRSAGKEVAAQLRHTRTQAVVSGVPQRFSIDPRTRRWQAAGGRDGQLPAALAVRFAGARQAQARTDEGVIGFFEDGASTGGRIELSSGSALWRVDVSWITGEVSSGPGRADAAR